MTCWLGRERVELAVCDSTSDEAARLAAAGAIHGTVVIAHAQRAGRGRLGRRWYSPPGENLYLSCLLRPACEPAMVPPITLAAGLGVVDAVNALGARARLKWPNDVLLDGRKLAGVLTEMSTRGGRVEHVICGIGINLAIREFPPELAATATSLYRAGITVDSPEFTPRFTSALLASLELWLDCFFTGGVAAIASAWLERAGLGTAGSGASVRVRATTAGGVIEGHPVGLDETGRLRLATDDGRVHHVIAGEIAEL